MPNLPNDRRKYPKIHAAGSFDKVLTSHQKLSAKLRKSSARIAMLYFKQEQLLTRKKSFYMKRPSETVRKYGERNKKLQAQAKNFVG